MVLGFIVGMLWATPFWIIFGSFFKDNLNDEREISSLFVAWLFSIAIAFAPNLLGYNPYVSHHHIYGMGGKIYNQTQLRGSIIVGACCALTYASIYTMLMQDLLLLIYDLCKALCKRVVTLLRKFI